MNSIHSELYTEIYNSTMSVEEANNIRQSRIDEFKSMLKEISKNFSTAENTSLLGLRLIHKHFDLKTNQIVHETSALDENNKPIFIAKAKYLDESEESYPNSWSIYDDKLVPFEYSNDKSSCELHEEFDKFSNDLNMIMETIKTYGFESIIGPAINRRTMSEAVADGGVYMEHTDYSETANVLKLQAEVPKSNSIETSWGFDPKIANAACGTWCDSYCYALSPGHSIRHWTGHGPIV